MVSREARDIFPGFFLIPLTKLFLSFKPLLKIMKSLKIKPKKKRIKSRVSVNVIPVEHCIALAALGFEESCRYGYTYDFIIDEPYEPALFEAVSHLRLFPYHDSISTCRSNTVLAPTWDEAIAWYERTFNEEVSKRSLKNKVIKRCITQGLIF